jgi:hypothetical protein
VDLGEGWGFPQGWEKRREGKWGANSGEDLSARDPEDWRDRDKDRDWGIGRGFWGVESGARGKEEAARERDADDRA